MDNNLKQIKKEVQNLISTLSCEHRASSEGETAIRNLGKVKWYQRNRMKLEQHYISRTVALSFAYEQAKRLEYVIDKMFEDAEDGE
ncbi:hypothetical protein ACFFH2_02760 [Enterococcus devriesei]|nr:hypothetical protein [Enterococcus devriesei]